MPTASNKGLPGAFSLFLYQASHSSAAFEFLSNSSNSDWLPRYSKLWINNLCSHLFPDSRHGSWLPPEWMKGETKENTQDQNGSILKPNLRSDIPSLLPYSTFFRTESVSPAYTQVEGVTGRCEYQSRGITGGHSWGCLQVDLLNSFIIVRSQFILDLS